MNITSESSPNGDKLTIRVAGPFDFKCHADFRRAYETKATPSRQIVVDLGDAEYIDSSALGMLLLLREHSGGANASVTITNARPAVAKILRVANFHQLFALS